MKTLLINLTIYTAMIAAMVADEFYSIEYAGNVAIFVAWFFIIMGFLALTVEPEKLFSQKRYPRIITKTYQYLMIGVMVAIGWTFTGLFYFLAAICMHIKYANYKNQPAEKAAA